MTAKSVNIKERKDKVLGIAIEQYIRTVSPVSSALIVRDYLSDLSSATIRNILAELESDGYLTHPHISSGRVPTQEGYRYYVDNIIDEIQLLKEEKERVKKEYEKDSKELEALLEKTSESLSNMTNYISIVSIDSCSDKVFYRGTGNVLDYVDYQDINKMKYILIALEEKGRLLKVINRELQKKIDVYIGTEMNFGEIDNCSLAVSRYTTNKGYSGRLAVLGPTRMDYERVISVLNYFAELMEEIL